MSNELTALLLLPRDPRLTAIRWNTAGTHDASTDARAFRGRDLVHAPP